VSNNPLLVVSRRNLLLVVSTSTTRGRSVSLTNSSPTQAWISGRDPLLVVSIVTAQKIPFIIFVCSFIFMHHHALSPACFSQSKLFFLKPILLFASMVL
jgi:hypothetical protein